MEQKKPFTTEEMLSRMRPAPHLAYEFNAQEILEGTKQFLQYVGYQLQSPAPTGSVQPDFWAKRQAGTTSYEIAGIVIQHLDELAEGFAKLKAVKGILGDACSYVLAIPPVNDML